MNIYLVGGAVRDELLGRPVTERDWVVVGATPEELIAQGYQAVGKEFPVFLHPKTREEYALARTERKVGRGYKGFHFYTSPEVTLEEDLIRRDLTINAMARSESGELIDPFGGQQDLRNKILRHVSPAFAEDPVRILRIARFAARFKDFHVHPATNDLMKQMVEAGEVDALVSERVWQEFEKALHENTPQRFFEVLQDSDALIKLFPEISLESSGMHALVAAVTLTKDPAIRFAALCHHLSQQDIMKLCKRVRTPKHFQELASLTARWLPVFKNPQQCSPQQILDLLKSVDAFRRNERFESFLIACKACLEGIMNIIMPHTPSHQEIFFRQVFHAANTIDVQSLIAKGLTGEALAKEIINLRIAEIKKYL